MKTLKVAFLSSTVLEFFTSVAIAALAIYIGFSLYGAITWGPAASITLFSGLTILILAPEFFQPLKNLSQYYHDRASALGAANNLVETLDTDGDYEKSHKSSRINCDTKKQSETRKQIGQENKTCLELSNLSIGYGYDNQLVQTLNVKLSSGSILVVSGNSGSGKTTLINTIAGYIPALGGTHCITPSSSIPMAYLPQKAWIKNDTIYENLAALAPKATKTEMLEVLNQLGLADELALKHNGLDTNIGEHEKGLSGGQMQRIAFARLLLNPTPIVLLDEPTAKLDAISKNFIIDALKAIKSNVIMVIATHDPMLINMSDVHINLNDTEE
jgi:ATP-binding cassette subfamily C protein CydD